MLEDLQRLEQADILEGDNQPATRHPIMRAFGGWADRADLDTLLNEIYEDRAAPAEREVIVSNFHESFC